MIQEYDYVKFANDAVKTLDRTAGRSKYSWSVNTETNCIDFFADESKWPSYSVSLVTMLWVTVPTPIPAPELKTETLINYILNHTYMTGSLAYGLLNPPDHDRFCTKETFNAILRLASECGEVNVQPHHNREDGADVSGGDNTNNVDIRIPGFDTPLNIFAIDQKEMDSYKAITEMVTVATKYFPRAMQVKPMRIYLFCALKQMMKLWSSI